MWLEHLKTVDMNRKRGAAKAAETRRQKREKQVSKGTHNLVEVYCCGICGVAYGDSDESEYWIGCEACDTWYHGECVISPANEPDKFFCSGCA